MLDRIFTPRVQSLALFFAAVAFMVAIGLLLPVDQGPTP